jgi:hypothetical protein
MSSQALTSWSTIRRSELDEIEAAHRSVGGTGPGRRFATQQINYAYAMLLSSQFQGFCRELHSECIDFLTASVLPTTFRVLLRQEFAFGRKLDKGNPNAGNIGSDFGRLGLSFWDDVESVDTRTAVRKELLEELNLWRNAIAHQDFDPNLLGSATLRVSKVRDWRSACDGLASSFDEAMRLHLTALTSNSPW